jgi:hypothetical protein
MPDTTWPETGTPARPCSRSSPHGCGFDVIPHYDDTSTAVRGYSSSWSPPDTSWVPFPHRSPRRSSANAACGGLKPPPNRRLRRANLHLLQNIESRKSLLHLRLRSSFVAHVVGVVDFGWSCAVGPGEAAAVGDGGFVVAVGGQTVIWPAGEEQLVGVSGAVG